MKKSSGDKKWMQYFNGMMEVIVSSGGGNEDGSHGVIPDKGNN